MSTPTFAGFALDPRVLAIFAVLLTLPYFVWLITSRVNTQMLGVQLIKLMQANNLDRAIKLLHAFESPLATAMRVVFFALRDGLPMQVSGDADYRSPGALASPKHTLERLRSLCNATFAQARSTKKGLRIVSWIAVPVLLVSVALSVLVTFDGAALGITVAGSLWLLNVARLDWQSKRDVIALFEQITPAILATASQGPTTSPR
ncbi:MAG: hypothetical protein Q8Q09_05570 [Deltaproteobacteria bacterium]|nr:hypothetical protein [Deltaproteobacteria bacterium]